MDITVVAYLVLLALVATLRLVELRISKQNQREMLAHGAAKVAEPRFRWMVLLHTAVLIGSAVEVVFLHRPFIPVLAGVMFAIFLAANGVRWWVIRTLGEHWNGVDNGGGGNPGARGGSAPAPIDGRAGAICESRLSRRDVR